MRDALVVDEPHPGARIERLELDDAASGVDGAEDRADPGDVIGRNADQRGFFRPRAEELHGADDVRRELTLAQDRGLRRAGRTAGEQHGGDVVGLRHGRRGRALPGCVKELVSGSQDESVREAVWERRVRPGDQRAWRESSEHDAQLIGREPVADRHECLPGQRRAEQQHGDRRRVAVQEPGPLAGLGRQPLSRVPGEARQPAYVMPSVRGPSATRWPAPSAAISSSRAMFIRGQSEAGSGLGVMIVARRPSTVMVPVPALVHSTWSPVASSA